MTPSTFSEHSSALAAQLPAIRPAFRSPRRVTITLPYMTYQDLQARADGEGRSLSNLAAFLLESSLHDEQETTAVATERRTAKPLFH